MKKLTLSMFVFLLGITGLRSQSCTDLNGYVDSKNVSATGAYTLQIGQEEMAAQTYHYTSEGKISSVRVYGNYPGITAGVPLRVGIYNVDANERPTTALATSNLTWWWFNNAAGYMTAYFPGGGVNVNGDFAITVELRSTSPWGQSFQLQYTGDGEGQGEDLASLSGTSTGFNWTSAMTNFNKDGDFYLVPRMMNTIDPEFSASSTCVAANAPVSFTNSSVVTTDPMFNLINQAGYTGSMFNYTWDFGDASAAVHTANATHAYAAAGSYTVTLTCGIDGWSTDCSQSVSTVISVGLDVTGTSVAASCNGSSNGSITLTGAGGTSPYTYSLNDGANQPGNTFSNLTAGTYSVTITDDLGCQASTNVTVTQPSAIVFNNMASTNSSCGGSDGALLISASGGTGALQYQLNAGPFQSNGSFPNLPSDFYTITVKDANNCTATNYVAVNDQGAPVLTVVSQTNASCNGNNDGSIVLSGTGGSGTLQYSVNGGNTWQTSGSFPSLTAGTYLAMVKDANGCSSAIKLLITQPNILTFRPASTPVSCNGGFDGTITVLNAIGGTGSYTYSLDNISWQTSNVFTGLAGGLYTVYVRDVAGCTANNPITVAEPTALTASSSVVDAGCNGSYDGSVSVTANGGTSPYWYSIDAEHFQPTGSFSELQSGYYTITVRDENGCQVMVNAAVSQPTIISATINTGSSSCGNANGTLLAAGSGGSGSGYTYSLDGTNFNTTGSFSGLLSGNYNVIVRDGAGCENVFPVSINDANGPVITSLSHTNVGCNGGNDGSITVNTVTGGSGTLMYSANGSAWQTSTIFPGLSAGAYSVLVKDVNGCVGEYTVTLTEPNPIVVTYTTIDVSCYGSFTGSITVNAAGGAGTLAYSLGEEGPYQSSSTFNNLPAGDYVTYVRDAAGCYGNAVFSITQPDAIVVNAGILDEMCNGDNNGAIFVNAAGGTGTLQYSLDGLNYQSGTSFTGLTAGDYTVFVQDANGCVEALPVTITEPHALDFNYSVYDVICSGGNNGVIDMSVFGGTEPYQYDWSNGGDTEDQFNLTAGSYSVTVTDNNGCSFTQSFTITQPANPLIANGVIVDATTSSSSDGGVNLTITGGTAPYTYLWNNGATTQNLSGVGTGVYTVIITDANGCVTSGIFFIGAVSGVANVVVDPSSVTMYPNPAHDQFSINAGSENITKLEVMNMLGEVIYSAEPEAVKAEVNTTNLANGVYFVRVYVHNNVITKRLEVSK